ncbi:ATP-dependent DNA helicase RecG [Candidatus Saccharibacteria bacterium]|nr:ATP-dependent DNA helicase RecG [Candidatus Saccharibacteria bacterium]
MALSLDSRVEEIKGVGPKTSDLLEKAGLKTVKDLLYYLPRTYDNFTETTKLSDIRPGKVVVRGKISDLKTERTRRRNFTITSGVIHDETDAIRVVWFNQPYRAKNLDPDKDYYFSGTYDFNRGRYQLTSPKIQLTSDVENSSPSKGVKQRNNSFQPVYPVRGQLKSDNFRRLFETLRPEFAFIPDLLPNSKPGARADALFKAHFAETDADVAEARNYLAYEELFELILAANLNKKENQKLKAEEIPFVPEEIQKIVKRLPFKLTNAQRKALFQIFKNLEKPLPMNRLLQGDVGSGKTAVAALSAFDVIKSGFQVAFLAPTAILASQHAESLDELLRPFGIKTALLTGATKRKPELKQKIKDGKVDLVVGTHALITDDTEFKNLALCLIDEQHRFGVNQRQKLLEKTVRITGKAPHLLMMTATPIPRSLQLAIFGDLDVSVLDELPAGRQPIKTKIISEINYTDELYPLMRDFLNKHQQIYWICKTIEDSPSSETVSLKKQTEKLKSIFKTANVAFLHGRMKPEEKDKTMSAFSEGKIDILVSTTVVEVGVNVPNANLMVITDAEGYGLAQLHQLRGRIGRGKDEAFCFLVTSGDSAPSQRLKELEKSTDGFYLAEADLRLRGPGEIYGSLQHGALSLRFASLTDSKLISLASDEAKRSAETFAAHPENLDSYPELKSSIKKYQQLTTLN